jgi:hypothetical protein
MLIINIDEYFKRIINLIFKESNFKLHKTLVKGFIGDYELGST